jgi:hypothetical protein
MQRILSASKDTYITNKIINNSVRMTNANAGSAGTLDLFKLYGENTISGEANPVELSRLLIKFPIDTIRQMDDNGLIDVNSNTFKCHVKLHDVYGGQTTPSNFKAILFPLAQKFDEGSGLDIVNFSDMGTANFLTASILNGEAVKWNLPGAMKSGSLGESDLDVYTSGSLSGDNTSLTSEQIFETGKEDLFLDVTKIVSGVISNQIPDHGFLIGLSGSYEKNNKTYFVKRFASRNVQVASLRPKLFVKYDDSQSDSHSDMIFNTTGSLYLRNYHQGELSNILSGSSATSLQGNNCMVLKLEWEDFKKLYQVDQAKNGRHDVTGVYKADLAVSSFDPLLYSEINASGSITFNEVWTNSQETVTYLSSSLKISAENRRKSNTKNQNNLLVTVLNVNEEYRQGEKVNIRVFAEERDRPVEIVRRPLEKKSQIFRNMFYRVRDVYDGKILIDFDKVGSSTKLSTDEDGMFFTFYTDSLPRGRTYSFDFLIERNGADTVIKDAASKFRIV